ncbi:MAG: DUF805 domain-containing protein [Alphaproteobacteria bacterium]|nr:DUF805 domain-containing protein [Alphaproteobacteria bacterium]MBU1515925.1 DUF805 domain-containing protein [Alphaproteobacteria bacterium]MBU2094147.1 DUF805 domain-containing protein [Alphaproteobacteria bacterium]MBU2151499.1 DUF805 domain-containing protein [Alphaproteobacteria bacterium]MBU2305225.1 DUF805 domain-containing protein [Alphaproteobacteria bacterium]
MVRIRQLFSFQGRARRGVYWLSTVPLALIMLVAVGLTMAEDERVPVAVIVFAVAVIAVTLLGIIAVSVRRLHDRNKSGWWMLLYWLAPTLLAPGVEGEAALISLPIPGANTVFALLSVGLSVWSFVDLACLKGSPRGNRFGPDPLGRETVEVFS